VATRNDYILVFLVAFGVTLIGTPLARWLAVRCKVVVEPDARRVHLVATPMLGGLAMLAGVLAAFGAATQIDGFDAVFTAPSVPLGVVLGAVLMCGLGTIDDIRPVSPPAKTAGMVLAGSVLSLLGVSIVFLRIPFAGILSVSTDLAPLLTVIWVLGMANAVNLIDGLDGLAAGIVAIAAGAFFMYAYRLSGANVLNPENPSALTAVIVVGICLGFLPLNFHPAKIFMGDGGALMLGLLMAASTVLVGGQANDPYSGQVFFFYAPLAIPFFVMGVPILDTAFAIIRRASKRSGLSEADKGHLHHRLMRLGHGQRRSVLILWLWTALLSGFVLYPVYNPDSQADAVVPMGVAALGLVLYTLFHPGIRGQRDTTV
jgi:UDP-GlcNAc:undecaprenyl-phosphate GlcNAc-1-phosphate transferase